MTNTQSTRNRQKTVISAVLFMTIVTVSASSAARYHGSESQHHNPQEQAPLPINSNYDSPYYSCPPPHLVEEQNYNSNDDVEYRHDNDLMEVANSVPSTSQISSPILDELFNYDSISFALRVTCEVNRQLSHATNPSTCIGGHLETIHDDFDPNGGALPPPPPINVHPSQPWFHPIPKPAPGSSPSSLTLFHCKNPRPQPSPKNNHRTQKIKMRRGTQRWGPDLSSYLEQICQTMRCSSSSRCMSLAILFLDRACSAQTIRNDNTQSCPRLTPRTAHRLILTAMILASKVVDEDSNRPGWNIHMADNIYSKLAQLSGIQESTLLHMEAWMLSAMGESGTFVTLDQMTQFVREWSLVFESNGNNNDDVLTTNGMIQRGGAVQLNRFGSGSDGDDFYSGERENESQIASSPLAKNHFGGYSNSMNMNTRNRNSIPSQRTDTPQYQELQNNRAFIGTSPPLTQQR